MKPTAMMFLLFGAAALAVTGAAYAQQDTKQTSTKAAAAEKGQKATHSATGVVKRIDQSKGTVTLAHEAIPSLKWPAMTMSFKVADKGLLQQLKPESKVAFIFAQQGKDYVITSVK